jgi:tRNA (guanosine-2'-O-)-methyltransferase
MNNRDIDRKLCEHFSQYISDHKQGFVERVLDQRTKYITLVLEDIYQSQNASAVIRTCECMGIQNIHIIENESKYMVNRKVLKGSYKWVDLFRYRGKGRNNTALCFEELKCQGYKIAITDPSPRGMPIQEVSIDNKIALVMGNELNGISSYATENADLKVNIPMYGFTESLNISVSAAICLNSLINPLRKSSASWKLTEEEKNEIRLRWYRKMIRNSEIIEREFLKTNQ